MQAEKAGISPLFHFLEKGLFPLPHQDPHRGGGGEEHHRVRAERGGDGVARFDDADRAEVDGDGVEGGLT